MLKVTHRFGKHCSCHLQVECVLVGRFLNPYIGQAVGGEWDVTGPSNQHIFTLKMATAMFAKTDNFQHSTRLIPESRRLRYNS
jgi:hypothetical protein